MLIFKKRLEELRIDNKQAEEIQQYFFNNIADQFAQKAAELYKRKGRRPMNPAQPYVLAAKFVGNILAQNGMEKSLRTASAETGGFIPSSGYPYNIVQDLDLKGSQYFMKELARSVKPKIKKPIPILNPKQKEVIIEGPAGQAKLEVTKRGCDIRDSRENRKMFREKRTYGDTVISDTFYEEMKQQPDAKQTKSRALNNEKRHHHHHHGHHHHEHHRHHHHSYRNEGRTHHRRHTPEYTDNSYSQSSYGQYTYSTTATSRKSDTYTTTATTSYASKPKLSPHDRLLQLLSTPNPVPAQEPEERNGDLPYGVAPYTPDENHSYYEEEEEEEYSSSSESSKKAKPDLLTSVTQLVTANPKSAEFVEVSHSGKEGVAKFVEVSDDMEDATAPGSSYYSSSAKVSSSSSAKVSSSSSAKISASSTNKSRSSNMYMNEEEDEEEDGEEEDGEEEDGGEEEEEEDAIEE